MTAWIGNACGFWGDRIDAAASMVQKEPNLQYLTLDYLSELSMSIMAVQMEKDPQAGYAKDFVEVIDSLIPFFNEGRVVKIVTNAGGLNPAACAAAIKTLLDQKLKRPLKIAIVTGDDVTEHFKNVSTANAYLGANSLIDALVQGAEIIIAGRIADPSLTVACAAFHFGWKMDEYDKIAQATVAGHLIECGCQVTGGLMDDWMEIDHLSDIGYPFVIMQEDGSFLLKKPENSDGRINLKSVKEQLIYEVLDPGNYLSPDATVDFLNIHLLDAGKDTVAVKGAKGKAPPPTYKVSTTVRKGWQTSSEIGLVGDNLVDKGERICAIILKRLGKKGHRFSAVDCSLIGLNGLSPYLQSETHEALLRISVQGEDLKGIELFTKELAPFITCGPQGVCAYTSGRSSIRPFFEYIPGIIDRGRIKTNIQFIEAGCS